jgi:hypothetical protein
MDLNSISSNLLLIGFALVSICCLYLLYSNFTKVREIEELKSKVEDLKKIFFNQQKHNDETYSRMLTMIQGGASTENAIINTPEHPLHLAPHTIGAITIDANTNIANEMMNDIKQEINTKIINIDPNLCDNNIPTTIIISKEGLLQTTDNKINKVNEDTKKEITLDLQELDNLEPAEDNLDDIDNASLNNILNDNIDNDIDEDVELLSNKHSNVFNDSDDIPINKSNIFEINNIDDTISEIDIDNITDNIIDDINDDSESIATEPIDADLDDIICNNNIDIPTEDNDDFTIDNLDDNEIDIEGTLNEITITQTDNNDIKNIEINLDNTPSNNDKLDDLDLDVDLNDILNGKSDNVKKADIKTIEIETISNDNKTNLNNMSIKQLKDLAKTHKLKSTGTKNELINALSKVIS